MRQLIYSLTFSFTFIMLACSQKPVLFWLKVKGTYFLASHAKSLYILKTNAQNSKYNHQLDLYFPGKYDDQIFHVTALGFPPPEPSKITR